MEDFIPYELAVKLNRVGFNYDTKEVYEINILLERYFEIPKPTTSQVLKWLREEKKIYICIDYCPAGYDAQIYTGLNTKDGFHDNENYFNETNCCPTYEQAALAGISWTLDNLI